MAGNSVKSAYSYKPLCLLCIGVSISTLWPATAIKSHVTDIGDVPDSYMRTPHIFADAVLGIVNEPTDKYV